MDRRARSDPAIPQFIHPDVAERYAVLLDLARTLASTMVPTELYEAVYDHVTRVLPTSAFTVGLVDSENRVQPVFRMGERKEDFAVGPESLERLHAGDFVLSRARGGRPSVLAAPLLRENRLLGFLAAERHRANPAFTPDDTHFLLAVGRLAGVALDNATLFERLQRRGAEAERLERIARDIGATLDLDEVAGRVANHAYAIARAPTVVWLRDGSRLQAVARAGGASIDVGSERALPPVLEHRYPVGSDGHWAGDRTERGSGARERADSARGRRGMPEPIRDAGRLLIPLVLGERLIGVLAVGARARDHETWLPTMRRMMVHAASALENARLHAKVRQLSLTDPLVQLPNRRQLDLFLEKGFEAARRGRPLCLVLYDLDHFKEYNDARGHWAGDIALIRFAEILRRDTRAMNLSARYGGEEFATVLADTDRAGGVALADRVRRRVLETFDGDLTVSAGVAEYSAEMEATDDLIVAADRALYRAKVTGRNRVCSGE